MQAYRASLARHTRGSVCVSWLITYNASKLDVLTEGKTMHPFVRLFLWCGVLATILVVTSWLPKSESVLRSLLAGTFLLWVIVGVAWFLRGMYRFILTR